jgi:hypothetical protein
MGLEPVCSAPAESVRTLKRITLKRIMVVICRCCPIGLIFLLSGCEKIEEAVISPDGKITAEVVSSTSAGATDVNTTYIEIHEKHGSKHIVFGGSNYGAEITVSWIDSKNLTVVCQNCSALQRRVKDEDKWHNISIHYDMR